MVDVVGLVINYLFDHEEYCCIVNVCASLRVLWKVNRSVLEKLCRVVGTSCKTKDSNFNVMLNLLRFLNKAPLNSVERFVGQYLFRLEVLNLEVGIEREVDIVYELDDFKRMYGTKFKSTLKAAEHDCHNIRGISPFFKYTFQIAFHATESYKARMEKLGRKRDHCLIQRMFHSVPSAEHCISFYLNWFAVQSQSVSKREMLKISSLMECGVLNTTEHLRKWILDIDAPLKDLFAKGMIQNEENISVNEKDLLNRKVLMVVCGICHTFEKYSVLDKPCHFTVLTRHTDKKMSWHITLNALTFYENWRHCIKILDEELVFKDPMMQEIFQFIDKSTKNNSKSQYMQVLNSCKLNPCSTPVCFTFFGIFNGKGEEVHLQGDKDSLRMLQYAASSMMIHDPFCSVFKRVFKGPEKVKNGKKGVCQEKEKDKSMSNPSKSTHELCSWKLLREEEKWMKDLIYSDESDLCFMPSMKKPSNFCDSVVRLLSTGQCEVIVHAMVRKCKICVRNFKVFNKWHVHSQNDKCIVMCIRQWSHEIAGEDYRMFVYCLSSKCKTIEKGWVEMKKHDYDKMQSMKREKV